MKKILINKEQRNKLNDLWFIYGNNGKKCTMANHKFIQNILDYGEDNREFYKKPRLKCFGQLTDECIKEVDKIINL